MFVCCQGSRGFTLGKFKEIKNLVRANPLENDFGTLYTRRCF